MATIKMVAPEIKGKAGTKVRLVVEFANTCYACIHERREGKGYKRICDQHTNKLVYDALLYEDTTNFVISTKDSDKPHLSFEGNTGQLWCPVTIVDEDVKPDPEPEHEDDTEVLSRLSELESVVKSGFDKLSKELSKVEVVVTYKN